METALDKVRSLKSSDLSLEGDTPTPIHIIVGFIYEDIKHVVNKCIKDKTLDVEQEIENVITQYKKNCKFITEEIVDSWRGFLIGSSLERYYEYKPFGFNWGLYPFECYIDGEYTPLYYRRRNIQKNV